MKRILLLLLCTIGLTTQAQEYFVDGYTFTYGVAKQDSLYSIVATVKSNCMVFLKDCLIQDFIPAISLSIISYTPCTQCYIDSDTCFRQ